MMWGMPRDHADRQAESRYDVTKWYVKGQGNPANRNAGVSCYTSSLLVSLAKSDQRVTGWMGQRTRCKAYGLCSEQIHRYQPNS